MNGTNFSQDAGVGALFDFTFKRFITLSVVKALYLLLLVLAAVTWLIGVIAGFTSGFGVGLVSMIVFTLVVIIQVIVWRVLLELVVVIFRIGENTSILASGGTGGPPTGGFPVGPATPVTDVPPVA